MTSFVDEAKNRGKEIYDKAQENSEKLGCGCLLITEDLGCLDNRESYSMDKYFRKMEVKRFVLQNNNEELFRNIMALDWFGWKLVGVKKVRCDGDLVMNGLEFKQTNERFKLC